MSSKELDSGHRVNRWKYLENFNKFFLFEVLVTIITEIADREHRDSEGSIEYLIMARGFASQNGTSTSKFKGHGKVYVTG